MHLIALSSFWGVLYFPLDFKGIFNPPFFISTQQNGNPLPFHPTSLIPNYL